MVHGVTQPKCSWQGRRISGTGTQLHYSEPFVFETWKSREAEMHVAAAMFMLQDRHREIHDEKEAGQVPRYWYA